MQPISGLELQIFNTMESCDVEMFNVNLSQDLCFLFCCQSWMCICPKQQVDSSEAAYTFVKGFLWICHQDMVTHLKNKTI